MQQVIPGFPKLINYYQTIIFGNYIVEPNKFNLFYASITAPAIVTLPNLLSGVTNGQQYIFKNLGPSTLTIQDSNAVFITSLVSSDSYFITANVDSEIWESMLGPIGSASTPI